MWGYLTVRSIFPEDDETALKILKDGFVVFKTVCARPREVLGIGA
jgi:hypothetical protein